MLIKVAETQSLAATVSMTINHHAIGTGLLTANHHPVKEQTLFQSEQFFIHRCVRFTFLYAVIVIRRHHGYKKRQDTKTRPANFARV